MIQDQTSSTLSKSRNGRLPTLALFSSWSSQSTSGPSSTRSKQDRGDSTPQLQLSSSSRTPSRPPTTFPPSSDASSSVESFKTADSLPSPAPPSPASSSPSHASSSSESRLPSQSTPFPERETPLSSNLNLNKPLPILPPPSRPPSSYGYGSFVPPPPPPAYTPFDPHALFFHISFPYIYASSSNDASSTATPRYQVSISHTRAGRPHQLALRRLTRSESRRVAFTSTGGDVESMTTAIPFDFDLTLYTATYFSPRAALPEIRGCKASTVAGRLVPSSTSSFAAGGLSWKGRGPSWELCRLTRERAEGGERDGQWEYREKEVWRRDVVFSATERTEKEGVKRTPGGDGESGLEEGRRVRRKSSLGLSLRRGLRRATAPTNMMTARRATAGEQRYPIDSNEGEMGDAELPSQKQRRHHSAFEWRAGTVSLSSPSPPSSTTCPPQAASSSISPAQFLATSGAVTTTATLPINVPAHAATAPPTTGNPRSNGGVAGAECHSSNHRRAGTTSTANTTPSSLRHRSSSTALALRRVASRVSLRTDNTVPSNGDSVVVDEEALPPQTPRKKGERARKAQMKTTRRWLRLDRPLDRRALDALVLAWVVSVWMDMDGQGTGFGEEGKG